MSRIGKLPVSIPEKVEVKVNGRNIEVKGEKGTLTFAHSPKVEVKIEDGKVIVSPLGSDAKALWGTTRSVIANMIEGVSV
jgi:large subunit ribosomal protein L6